MPTLKLQQINAWSYSRYTTYQECPFKAKLTMINRLREPEHPAQANGARIHLLASAYITRKIPDDMPQSRELLDTVKKIIATDRLTQEDWPDFWRFEQELVALRQMQTRCDQEWAFDREWQACRWNDWVRAWLRVKVDAYYFGSAGKRRMRENQLHIVDFKTGKIKDDHIDQRSLYALAGLLMFPDVTKVTAAHWYFDQGVESKDEWDGDELEKLKKEWLRKTKAMLNDSNFAPRPGNYCRWCHFRKDNGGPCKF